MRSSARIVTCSVATLIGVACSGTTVTQGDGRGGAVGVAGNSQTTRSSATAQGGGGRSAAHSGGNTAVSSVTTAVASGSSTTVASNAAGSATNATNAIGGAGGATTNQPPVQGGGTGGVAGTNLAGSSARAGSSAAAGGTKPTGGAGGAAAAAGRPGSTGGSTELGATGGRTNGGATATGGVSITGGNTATGGSVATGGTSTSSTTAPPPSITTASPSSGIVTTTVVLTGQNFGAAQGTSTITIAGTSVTPAYWSNTSIEVPVPRSVYPGSANIVVTVGGKASNSATFDVVLPRTVYINKADRASATGNSVSAFTLTAYGFIELSNSPFISGDTGTSGGSDGCSLALHRATRRLFVLNDYSVSAFDIDPVTGALTRTPNSPVSTGGGAGAAGIVVNAAGNLVYVANVCSTSDNCRYSNASISAFKVSATGVLSLVTGSPFNQDAGGGGVRNPALIHGDQFLVATGDFDRAPPFNHLVVNSVNATTGVITPVTGSPFGVETRTWSARPDPTGNWYYMSDTNSQLTGFLFQNSGAPTRLSGMPIATKTTSFYPNGMAISADGTHLYMGSWDSNEVSVFTLNAGIATLMPESPRQLDVVSAITALGVSRNGSQLVVADSTSKKLMVYPINSGFPYYTGQGDTFEDVGGASGLVIAE